MRFARPIERGIQRFAMVPPSTAIVWMRRFSTDALDRLADDARCLLRHEVEEADSLLDGLAANDVGDDAHLARRHRNATNECSCLHDYFFLSPVCPWNVRV
jgi:hypothetical protein